MYIFRSKFKNHGRNFIFDPYGIYSFETIDVGDDVYIGPGAIFRAANSSISIGNKVMFGPNVIIMGGNHVIDEIGRYMFDIKEKSELTDLPIKIKDDVWVGAGSIILHGVTIGTGSVIAAGSVVTRDVEDFSIVGGVPAKTIKKRFNSEQLNRHLKYLQDAEQ